MADIKEIVIRSSEYENSADGAEMQYREKGRRRRTRKVQENIPSQPTPVKQDTVVVEKTSKQKPIVVLSPPRKKTARILLVSSKTTKDEPKKIPDRRKTFRAKRVTVTIDNTAKTAKKKYLLMKHVDSLTEEQLRETVVAAKLVRKESVAKVPEKLLRQMLKDYQSIRGAYM
jgi:hypothetical protein